MYRFFSLGAYVWIALISIAGCHTPDPNIEHRGIAKGLQFKEDGTFRIAQFSDTHVHADRPEELKKTREVVEYILKTEKPDFSVITGDIVNSPAPEGWQFIADVFSGSGIPWAVTLGNHDDEDVWSRKQIFDFLEKQEGFAGIAGPDISGVGNYIIPVQAASSEETAALLYFFDSHGYPKNALRGDYDWIKQDQIQWYRHQSAAFREENNDVPYPALAFFHIPLPEFLDVVGQDTFMGIKEERVASPEINSGLFSSFVEMQDVLGVFTGHDHDNNYIGILHDVALAFGQTSGYGGYGKFAKGSRIIELKEGEYSFNTWIATQDGVSFEYNYPSGLSFSEEVGDALPSVQPAQELLSGVNYRYFEGDFTHTSEMLVTTPKRTGILANFDISGAEIEDHFGFDYTGYIQVPKTGIYNFYTFSDDGSRLYIGDSLVVDNDGSRSIIRQNGRIALEAGYHPIRLLYFEDYMGEKLEVGISSLTIKETPIRDEMLFRPRSDEQTSY